MWLCQLKYLILLVFQFLWIVAVYILTTCKSQMGDKPNVDSPGPSQSTTNAIRMVSKWLYPIMWLYQLKYVILPIFQVFWIVAGYILDNL